MTVAEAKRILEKPLRFGDPEQIEAHALLIWAKELEDSDEITCAECDGDGTHTCDCGDVHDCAECAGSGTGDKGDINRMTLSQIQKALELATEEAIW